MDRLDIATMLHNGLKLPLLSITFNHTNQWSNYKPLIVMNNHANRRTYHTMFGLGMWPTSVWTTVFILSFINPDDWWESHTDLLNLCVSSYAFQEVASANMVLIRFKFYGDTLTWERKKIKWTKYYIVLTKPIMKILITMRSTHKDHITSYIFDLWRKPDIFLCYLFLTKGGADARARTKKIINN